MPVRGPHSGLPCICWILTDGTKSETFAAGAVQCDGRTRVAYDLDYDDELGEKRRKVYCEKCNTEFFSSERITQLVRLGSIDETKADNRPRLFDMSE